MTPLARLACRVAGAVAGSARADWIAAMTAEAESSDNPTGWALGCCWAAIKDRAAREWSFVLAVLIFPIAAYGLELALFYPVAWLARHHWLPDLLFYASGVLSPVPFAILLGRIRAGLALYVGALVSFAIAVFFPLILFWIEFGKSPLSWFGDDATWYNMPPAAGLAVAFLVWFGGVWIGSRLKKRI